MTNEVFSEHIKHIKNYSMDVLIANIDALLNNELAITTMLESSAARMALYNNAEKVETVLASSPTVISIMKNSERCTKVSTCASDYGNGLVYDGKAFVLEVWSSSMCGLGGGAYCTFYHGNYIVGDQVRGASMTAEQATNHYAVRKFAEQVISYNSAASSYETNALIFKL